jgi:hypothetical protein
MMVQFRASRTVGLKFEKFWRKFGVTFKLCGHENTGQMEATQDEIPCEPKWRKADHIAKTASQK